MDFETLLSGMLREGGPQKGWPFLDFIRELSSKYGIPVGVILSIIKVESDSDPEALSSKGAMGLMQLMPPTPQPLGVRDPFNPEENLEARVRYLRELLDRFGDLVLALVAYNAGPEAVKQQGGIPPFPEAKNCISKIPDYLWQSSITPSPERQNRGVTPKGDPTELSPQTPKVNPQDPGLRTGNPEETPKRVPSRDLRIIPLLETSKKEPTLWKASKGGLPASSEGKTFLLTRGFEVPIDSAVKEEVAVRFPSGRKPPADNNTLLLPKGIPLAGVFSKDSGPLPGAKGVYHRNGVRSLVQELVTQIVQRVKVAEGKGIWRIEVHLRPEILGGLRVKITRSDEGLKANITTFAQGVKSLVEAHLSEIQRALQMQGIKLVRVDINMVPLSETETQREGDRRKEQQEPRRERERGGWEAVFEMTV